MVSSYNEDTDTRLTQPTHAFYKIESCVVILPVSVIEIAYQQNKRHFLINCQFDQIIKGAASRAADFFYRSSFIALQAVKRTVEMNVCGVKEFHNTNFPSYLSLADDSTVRTLKTNLIPCPDKLCLCDFVFYS